MSEDDVREAGWEEILAVSAIPPAHAAYQRWLAGRPPRARGDYLFLDDRPRFEPRREDRVAPMDGLEVVAHEAGAALVVGDTRLPVPGVEVEPATRLLAAMDGRTLVEVGWEAEGDALPRLLRAAFGRVVFAPEAVATLEARAPGVEVQRFPASPYAIERSYWRNVADVRAEVARLDHDFWGGLRGLHVVLLLGRDLDSFYRPASPIAEGGVDPGRLLWAPVRRAGAVYFDGPRVRAAPLPHVAIIRALVEGVGDEEALAPRAVEEAGLPWGEVAMARGERDAEEGAWFFPPRPILPAHEVAVEEAWRRAQRAEDPLDDLADLHWRFVRLHPFRAGNQSLAMALIHARLGRGFPHLVLDAWALRLRREPYRAVFRRARARWSGAGEGAARLRELAALRRDFDRGVAAAGAGPLPEESRFALLLGEG